MHFGILNNLTEFHVDPITPFLDMHLRATWNQSILIRMAWTENIDLKKHELVFNTWSTVYKPKEIFNYFTPEMLAYNKTEYNLDTQCREDKLFTGPIEIQKFNEYFESQCMNR
mmetsp:Transcript_39352/g.60159  ORF Transcript_39352/g.60159 Transcript_39352/m.60159 type:complete len:113 (+) Transcript_39352:3298-3636(+)